MNKHINSTGLVCLSAFFIVYLVYFFYPVFYSSPSMQVFQSVPAGAKIGMDFFATVEMALSDNLTHYTPLSKILFIGISKIPILNNFYFFSSLSLIVFVINYMLLFRVLKIQNPIWIVFCGLFFFFSYPFQFEIERGQWNIIACFFILLASLLSINKKALLSSSLFGLSVSLKLYPLIFLPLLYKKENVSKFIYKGLLIGFSVALVFLVKGFSYFRWYLRTMTKYSQLKSTWIGNHSISSFCLYYDLPLVKLISIFIIGIILLYFLYILLFKDAFQKSFIHLFSILSIAACMIPSVSHDYKLSILGMCIPFLLGIDRGNDMKSYLFLFLIFLGYFSLHYSYNNIFTLKSDVLNNRFPVLILMYVCIFGDFLLLRSKRLLEDQIVIDV